MQNNVPVLHVTFRSVRDQLLINAVNCAIQENIVILNTVDECLMCRTSFPDMLTLRYSIVFNVRDVWSLKT